MDTQPIWQPEHLGRVLSWRWGRPDHRAGGKRRMQMHQIQRSNRLSGAAVLNGYGDMLNSFLFAGIVHFKNNRIRAQEVIH